jgi:hypothetical protein
MQNINRTYNLLFGAIAGLAFSLSLWGYEAILLFKAHVAYPWIPVVVGTALCVFVCTLVAWLTHLVNNSLLGLVFWVLAAYLIAKLTIAVPLKITPRVILLLEPGLQSWLPGYPYNSTLRIWTGISAIWLGIFFAIFGLLQLTLVEQAARAPALASRLTPYFVCVPIMVLASVMTSNLVNEQLRSSLLATDRLIQFAVDNRNTVVDPALARQEHLAALRTVSDLINRPRRLFLGRYDEYMNQINVLIDFDGEWAYCTTVSGQAIFCMPLQSP